MTETELAIAEAVACTEEFCFVCKRTKNCFGQHEDAQLEAWTEKAGIMQDIFWARLNDEV